MKLKRSRINMVKIIIKEKNTYLLPICKQSARGKKDKKQYYKYVVYIPKEVLDNLENREYLKVKI